MGGLIMRVCLVVRIVDNGNTVGGYFRGIDIPFVPTVGMKFKKENSTRLWETIGGELEPKIKEIVYNIDEEIIFCLFEINQFLTSTFWKEIKPENLRNSLELGQFEIH